MVKTMEFGIFNPREKLTEINKAVSFISFDENKFIWSFHTKFFLQQVIYSHKVDLT